MSDSKLMPVVYYNPAQVTRLTAYADTVVMERAGNEAFLRGIRFGGYPESVQAISDAIYAGARLDVTINGKQFSLKSESKRYDRQVNRDGVYAEATILAKDDDQNAKKIPSLPWRNRSGASCKRTSARSSWRSAGAGKARSAPLP